MMTESIKSMEVSFQKVICAK